MDPAKLRDVRSLVEAFRGVVIDWDAIVASLEGLKREQERLRSESERLNHEHHELHQAYERLRRERADADRIIAELRADREALLRDSQGSSAALRDLSLTHEALRRQHDETAQVLDELREQHEALTRSSNGHGHGGSAAGFIEELARHQSGVQGIFRVSELVFEDTTSAVLADRVLADAIKSLRSDAALMLLCDRDGNFTESQHGNPVLVSQLHGLLDSSFKQLVQTGGKETLTLTGKTHPFSAVAALIPNTGNSIGVLCLGREPGSGTYLPDEHQFVIAYARSICLGLQNIYVRETLEHNLFDTMSFFVTALESRDPYLQGHSARVSLYAGEIASVMGLSPSEVAVVRRTGVLHDLGKLMLPDSIRLKPESLGKAEYALVMRHPLVAEKMLRPLRFLGQETRAVRHHLERHDGTGYPDGLKGAAIPLPARVVAVADCFDAMTSNRPYRNALPLETAVGEIVQSADTQFDPAVTAAFSSIPRVRLAEIGRYYDTGLPRSAGVPATADLGAGPGPDDDTVAD